MAANSPGDAIWRKALESSWKGMETPTESHLDTECLAAYAEGHLPEGQMLSCDEHLSRCPECLAMVEELWKHLDGSSNDESLASVETRKWPQSAWGFRYALAASLLWAVSGWAWLWHEHVQSANMRGQLARLEGQLTDTRAELVLAQKEELLEAASSPVHNYWAMTTSPRILQLPQTRGHKPSTVESRAQIERLRRTLQRQLAIPESRGWALLELATTEIAAGRTNEASIALREAEQILGATADSKNVAAVLLLAIGNQESVRKAEQQLRTIIRDNPMFLPARFNLALMLQQSFRDDESRVAWQEYLSLEQRPEFREAAKVQMSDLKN